MNLNSKLSKMFNFILCFCHWLYKHVQKSCDGKVNNSPMMGTMSYKCLTFMYRYQFYATAIQVQGFCYMWLCISKSNDKFIVLMLCISTFGLLIAVQQGRQKSCHLSWIHILSWRHYPNRLFPVNLFLNGLNLCKRMWIN